MAKPTKKQKTHRRENRGMRTVKKVAAKAERDRVRAQYGGDGLDQLFESVRKRNEESL